MDNYYQILGVDMRATPDEIKSAYKRMAMQYHPDRHQGSKFHEEYFKQIVEAYQTLSDPAARNRYDMKLFYRAVTDAVKPPPRPYGTAHEYGQAAHNRYRPATPDEEKAETGWGLQKVAIALLVVVSLVMLGYWCVQLYGRYQAEKAYKAGDIVAALGYDATFAPANFAKAQQLLAKRQPSEAMPYFDAAIQHADRTQPNYYRGRALCYVKLRQYEQATSDLQTVLRVAPQNDTALYELADLQVFVQNRPDLALPNLDKLLKMKPLYYDALFAKGYALLQMQRYDSANFYLEKAREANNTQAEVFYYQGFVKKALGDTAQARAAWQQAAALGFPESRIPKKIY
ncbi:Tetratricopeptide repeat-containing protein [Flexibacter flexilis DSM 6793]|uniref:Tetratricopeptide repeat-containing protein n=1 Tax=Flexibacter flexilis DSM 6793 TaxID=927664 RepID=A0A1I1LXF5_9BACT|nr:DnaJ domain-containing protein [Flexibacter flexilis]SFC74140.1 Tetratricopeptide repeat-containing protein [Flexibacter flexilis DSM 6793]